MRLKYKRIHIGRRTLKTALAVIVSLIVVSSYGTTTSKMIFGMLGAMGAMENTFQKSLESCLTQVVGMFFGVIAGILLGSLPIHPLICIGIGIIFMITMYNVLQIHFSPVLPCMIIVMVCTTPDISPVTYAVGRLWDTAIGLSIGMMINVLVLPYDNSLKIRQAVEYLQKEVIAFLEEMFDGDNDYPDTEKMIQIIDDMGSQLGIYSQQWLLFQVKKDKNKLEIFKRCQQKSRQLLAQMEVLHQMEKVGRLSEESKRRLKSKGINIKDERVIDTEDENDIITNYHIQQILSLRQELIKDMESLSSMKVK